MAGLDFEKPILELEKKIQELKSFMAEKKIDLSSEVKKIEDKLEHLKKHTYDNLTAWQKVQLARHPLRPYTLDYISMIMSDFIELHGDRLFSDDKAMICGFAKIDKKKIMVIGHQKGRDTKENLKRNFGCAHPEGYRKALRVMQMAEEFDLPVVVFIDTPGAYPGIGAEERGQSHAIALRAHNCVGQFPTRLLGNLIAHGFRPFHAVGRLPGALIDRLLAQPNLRSVGLALDPDGPRHVARQEDASLDACCGGVGGQCGGGVPG